jgi:predicted secreted protein
LRKLASALAGFTFLISAGVAAAGDTASLNVIGYSPDGKVFAFEEYGISDGSGYPYSNIYFVDTERDEYLPDTPFRLTVEEEAPVSQVREISHMKAEDLIAKYKLKENPGVLVAYNPPSEVDSDPASLRYRPFVSPAPSYGPVSKLELTTKDFPPLKVCQGMSEVFRGFTLKLTEFDDKPADKVVHEDRNVPASRGCALDYRIGAVVSSEAGQVPQMAMILVDSVGFEGPDRRWIAVPIKAEQP